MCTKIGDLIVSAVAKVGTVVTGCSCQCSSKNCWKKQELAKSADGEHNVPWTDVSLNGKELKRLKRMSNYTTRARNYLSMKRCDCLHVLETRSYNGFGVEG